MNRAGEWQGVVLIRRGSRGEADRVARTLAPEVAREVPRARAELDRPDSRTVSVRITAADTSACRAAVNTYLAWVGLVLATERAAQVSLPPEDHPKSGTPPKSL